MICVYNEILGLKLLLRREWFYYCIEDQYRKGGKGLATIEAKTQIPDIVVFDLWPAKESLYVISSPMNQALKVKNFMALLQETSITCGLLGPVEFQLKRTDCIKGTQLLLIKTLILSHKPQWHSLPVTSLPWKLLNIHFHKD